MSWPVSATRQVSTPPPPPSGGKSPRAKKRGRFLIPLGVTIVILAAAVLAAFIYTASYVDSAVSGLRPKPATNGGNIGQPTALAAGQADQTALLAQVSGAVWAVETLDANGNSSVGSAFAVASNTTQTLLVTSYSVVAAAIREPAPPLMVHQGMGSNQQVTLRTWDIAHDLGLLVLPKGNQAVLRGTGGVPPASGQQVYAVAGPGGPNGLITSGKLLAASAVDIEADTSAGNDYRGGPLIDARGEVLAVASLTYLPPRPGLPAAKANLSVPIQDACIQLLRCPGGSFS